MERAQAWQVSPRFVQLEPESRRGTQTARGAGPGPGVARALFSCISKMHTSKRELPVPERRWFDTE